MNSSNRLDRIIWPEQMDILCKENPFIASYYLKRISSIIQLKSVDKKVIPDLKNEIRLFAIMRNESLRLPHFINYYKKLGVDRFIIIDNNSSDSSVAGANGTKWCCDSCKTATWMQQWYG